MISFGLRVSGETRPVPKAVNFAAIPTLVADLFIRAPLDAIAWELLDVVKLMVEDVHTPSGAASFDARIR